MTDRLGFDRRQLTTTSGFFGPTGWFREGHQVSRSAKIRASLGASSRRHFDPLRARSGERNEVVFPGAIELEYERHTAEFMPTFVTKCGRRGRTV